MELKGNESTLNRPLGERAINAPAVLIHIPGYIEMIQNEKAWQHNDRNAITVFKSEDMTVVLTRLKDGASLEEVKTEGYTTLFVLEGQLQSSSGEEKNCVAGDLLIFHPAVSFSITAKKESSFLLTHFVGRMRYQNVGLKLVPILSIA